MTRRQKLLVRRDMAEARLCDAHLKQAIAEQRASDIRNRAEAVKINAEFALEEIDRKLATLPPEEP